LITIMAKPSNEELITLRNETALILGAGDDESLTDAATRVVTERDKFAGEVERLKSVKPSDAPSRPAYSGDNPPPMAPDKGDLTEEYARWMVATQSLAACQAQYSGREQHLPADVQAVLKGGQ
jgi:hypothetical protein